LIKHQLLSSNSTGAFNMIKGEQLIGKPVFTRTGQKLEPVRKVILNLTETQIIALMIDGEGGKNDPRAISFEGIETIGPDAIIVAEGVRGLPPASWPEVLNRLNEPAYVGRDVMTATGEHLGQIADLCFNEFTGRLEGIEISRGSLADIQGRLFVAAAGVVIGESIVVEQLALDQAIAVPGAVSRAVSNAGSSLAGAVSGVVTGVGDSLKGAISSAVSTAGHAVSGVVSNAASSAGGAIQAAASGAFDHAKERLEANQMRYVIGRDASYAVKGHAGQVIVGPGETITESHAKQALEQGMLQALFLSAGGAGILNAFAHAKDMAAQTLDKLRGNSHQDLGNLEVTVGYTVSRTVYGATDTPIILAGETVSLETIRRAASESFGADLINAVFGEMNPSPSFDDITDDPKADLAVQMLDGDGNPNVQAEDQAALRSALGQPVPRAVLDADGGEVLKTGEVITNDLLEHARTEAVLSELGVAVGETASKNP
jgi:uncharacterized protein YrrD